MTCLTSDKECCGRFVTTSLFLLKSHLQASPTSSDLPSRTALHVWEQNPQHQSRAVFHQLAVEQWTTSWQKFPTPRLGTSLSDNPSIRCQSPSPYPVQTWPWHRLSSLPQLES